MVLSRPCLGSLPFDLVLSASKEAPHAEVAMWAVMNSPMGPPAPAKLAPTPPCSTHPPPASGPACPCIRLPHGVSFSGGYLPLIQCHASLSSNATPPSHPMPRLPLIPCRASLSSHATSPSHPMPRLPLIQCHVSLSSNAAPPSHPMLRLPLIQCCASLSSHAAPSTHDMPRLPSCMERLVSELPIDLVAAVTTVLRQKPPFQPRQCSWSTLRPCTINSKAFPPLHSCSFNSEVV